MHKANILLDQKLYKLRDITRIGNYHCHYFNIIFFENDESPSDAVR